MGGNSTNIDQAGGEEPQVDRAYLAQEQGSDTIAVEAIPISDGSRGLSSSPAFNDFLDELPDSTRNPLLTTLYRGIAAEARDSNRRAVKQEGKIEALEAKVERLVQENADLRAENAALTAHVASIKHRRLLIDVLLVVGPVLCALGFDELKSNELGAGAVITVIGVVLIAAVLVMNHRGGGE